LVEDFVDFLFVLFEEVMGFIILKILVIYFFCLFSSVIGFIKSLFSDLFVSSSKVMGFINIRERGGEKDGSVVKKKKKKKKKR
jgi:hypothetical protein